MLLKHNIIRTYVLFSFLDFCFLLFFCLYFVILLLLLLWFLFLFFLLFVCLFVCLFVFFGFVLLCFMDVQNCLNAICFLNIVRILCILLFTHFFIYWNSGRNLICFFSFSKLPVHLFLILFSPYSRTHVMVYIACYTG